MFYDLLELKYIIVLFIMDARSGIMKKISNLSRYRQEKGFSQIELAKKMHVTQQCISSWQTGRTIPKPYQMKILSEILDIPVNELFYEKFNRVD